MTSFLPTSGRPSGFTNMSVGHQKCPMSDQMFAYAVESFSVDRFRSLSEKEILRRIVEFKEMTAFEHQLVESDG